MKIRGFTLIELMVTVSIMTLITAVTLVNHSKFGGKVLLRSTAYEMALVVREAQTYGISVRKIGFASGGSQTVLGGSIDADFNVPYGVHFDVRDKTHYITFADTYLYNGILMKGSDALRNTSLEDVTNHTIGKGYKINKLYVTDNSGARLSSESCPGTPVLDITFTRPEPDAMMKFCGVDSNLYRSAEIELVSPRGDLMKVLVEVSGQISVTK